MSVINIWGYSVFKGNLSFYSFQKLKQFLINTISPNSYGLSVRNSEVRNALKGSDILILDGLYFGLSALLTKGIKINRITGWDAFYHYSNELNEYFGKAFFLGSTKQTLMKIAEKYKNEFPNVEVKYYSPPFKPTFSNEDNQIIIQKINAFRPNILFVGMTAPKQEIWSFTQRKYLDVNIICTIGNVFDWYAGNSKRPGIFWQKIGLEWLVRIFYRPEIFKRNIANQMVFFWHLFLVIIKVKKI